MPKKQKLSEIRFAYLTHNITIYEALDKAYMEGRAALAAEYQNKIDDQTGKIKKVTDRIHEIANGK